eukprot:TRINITY_DN1447_c0_g1_i1.p1 TRINITY_DN1447_c0_g1~~TRINITY_DN1447_c0_g1_i1.p1  ORF type:complete len:492 (-),score=84.23 TRINITY_DN1447_c0_g1_i1:107-1582(-)
MELLADPESQIFSSFNEFDDVPPNLFSSFEQPLVTGDFLSENLFASEVDPSLAFQGPQISSPQSPSSSSSSPDSSSPPVKVEILSGSPNLQYEEQISQHYYSEVNNLEPKRKSRKRPRKSDLEPICQTALTLPRDYLLKLTCSEFEEYAQKLTQDRPLSHEEEQEFRRQKRLIKNRESAHASRVRKKSYVGELEQTISELKTEVQQLQSRNQDLENEVSRLRRALDSTGIFGKIKDLSSISPPVPPAIGGGVCLLIFLFALGLYMNPQVAQQTREFHHIPMTQIYTSKSSRTLLSAENRSHDFDEPGEDICNSQFKETYERALSEVQSVHEDFMSDVSEPSIRMKHSRSAQHKTIQSPPQPVVQPPQPVAQSAPLVDREAMDLSSGLVPRSATPNVTYFLCSDIKQIIPESKIQERAIEDEPLLVALIVPIEALRGSPLGAAGFPSNSLNAYIEVTCQVIEMNQVTVPKFQNIISSSNSLQMIESHHIPVD